MTKPEVVNILQPQTTMNPDRAKQVSRARDGVSVKLVSFWRRQFSHISGVLMGVQWNNADKTFIQVQGIG